jgi:hypothetical protein
MPASVYNLPDMHANDGGDGIAIVPERTLVLACATVIEEMLPLMPPGMSHRVFDFGLHANPESLKTKLQEAVDNVPEGIDTVILGYGLCSMAVAGLRSESCTLVVPRVDDCIAIFLGSGEAYRAQHSAEPGTYYLTKGWIEAGDGPFADYDRMLARYGREKADWILREMLRNYTRLALINTGQYEMDRYRERSRDWAARLDLRYEEIPGSKALIHRMLYGPWDGDFVIARPGETIPLDPFLSRSRS